MLRKTFMEGFTLVELSLSMVFIGILSISVVLIINNTMAAYRRGLALSQINTTGMGLVDDMRAAVQNSSVRTLRGSCALFYDSYNNQNCLNNNAYGLVLVKKIDNVNLSDGKRIRAPIYGAFCTGTYSYIWNSGYFDSDKATFDAKTNRTWAKLSYKNGEKDEYGNDIVKTIASSAEDENKPFRLLKVEDNSRSVCAVAMGSNYTGVMATNNVEIGMINSEPEDILVADNSNSLAIYDLDVAQPVESPSGSNAFYSVSFILGTITGGINVKAQGNACATPADYENENFDYCAINKFNFAVQVNGGI
ncbi:hypothetical protein IJJ36_04640 [Candidatus Saccharibacteria bacterium]|nr:hypothetical protein [Candidatus Saccharibacteria bacterium]